MTPGMQVRLWYRAASGRQRASALAVGLGAIALLVASVAVTTGSSGPTPSGARSLSAGASFGGPGSSVPVGGPPPSATPGAAAASPAAGGAASGPATGAVGVAGEGTAAAGGGRSDGRTGAAALTASDRGVTPTTIKIGFLVVNIAGLSASGFVVGLRSDAAAYARALGAYVNSHGGVDGRRIEVVTRSTDPTSQSDQAAACQSMVADDQVFGVVDEASMADTAAMQCLAVQHQTPFVHNLIWSRQWLARSQGMEVGYPAAIDRLSVTWARDLGAAGWLQGRPAVGVLGDQCEATQPVISGVLQQSLLRAGAGRVVLGNIGCDPQSQASDPVTFAQEFRAAGVTRVVLAANAVSSAVFTRVAQQEAWHPQYTVSDWWQLASGAATGDFDPNQFNGALAITSNGLLLPESGRPPPPGGALCSTVATAAGLPPLQYTSSNIELWSFCDNFFLMVAGLRAAGTSPTRTGWSEAVQRLGTMNSVIYGPSGFGPGKVTGSDQVFTAEWQKACSCFRAVSAWRPAAD